MKTKRGRVIMNIKRSTILHIEFEKINLLTKTVMQKKEIKRNIISGIYC